MPAGAIRAGVRSHASVFINDTLSRMNPHYVPAPGLVDRTAVDPPISNEAIVELLATP